MENFVFPDEIKIKLMTMYELMNIFPILTHWNSVKKLLKVVFIYLHWIYCQKGLYVLDSHSKGN